MDMHHCIITGMSGATIEAEGGGHAPPTFFIIILVFLLYWTPTFQCIDPPSPHLQMCGAALDFRDGYALLCLYIYG